MPLTEDKMWIAAAIAASARESEQATARAIAASESKLFTAIRESEQATARAIERTETNLLTAFHQWASPNDQKLRTHREAIRAHDLQIEEIASRVDKLEQANDRRSLN